MINSKPKKKVLKRKNPRDGGPDAESELSKWRKWALEKIGFSSKDSDEFIRNEIYFHIKKSNKEIEKLKQENFELKQENISNLWKK